MRDGLTKTNEKSNSAEKNDPCYTKITHLSSEQSLRNEVAPHY